MAEQRQQQQQQKRMSVLNELYSSSFVCILLIYFAPRLQA
jgi:hypothetical protein